MRTNTPSRSRSYPVLAAALALAAAAAGCAEPPPSGVVELADDPALADALAARAPAISLSLGSNGINQNGINQNGINQNGINQNGLTATGLSTTTFTTWFNSDPTNSDVFMRHAYRCAAAAGTSVTWKNSKTGKTYTWSGGLGLAPGWTAGSPASLAEQQVVTACLGALFNKYGVSVTIAVEGRTATGVQLAIGAGELTTYSVREACFFGNLFNGEGMFLAYDQGNWPASRSSVRGCAVDINGFPVDCTPIVTTGDECRDICRANASGTFWESCTWNGRSYRPLTTRLKPADLYECGDGVCQFTERCGSGTRYDDCRADCGLCP